MVKLLLVDDENYVRKQIKEILDAHDFFVSELREAASGMEALRIVEEFLPNVLVTDIKMPGMLGVELAKKISVMNPDCSVVFISGFADKEYLKMAIELSAVGFVEKPIIADELMAVMKKAKMSVENRELVAQSKDMSSAEERTAIAAMLTRPNADIQGKITATGIERILTSSIFTCVFKFHTQNNTSEKIAALKAQMNECKIEEIHFFKGTETLVVHFFGKEKDMKEPSVFIEGFIEGFRAKIGHEIPFNCACGRVVFGCEAVWTSFDEAVCTLDTTFFYPYFRPVWYLEATGNDEEENIWEQTKEFRRFLNIFDLDKAGEVIEGLYLLLQNRAAILSAVAKKLYLSLLKEIYLIAQNNHMDFQILCQEADASYELLNKKSLAELHEYFSSIFRLFVTFHEDEKKTLTRTVISYIEDNYKNPNLSVVNIADICNKSRSYLSTVFKAATGKTITVFVNELRIEAAKKLLRTTEISVNSISVEVGFNDVKYFSRVFRKMENIQPSRYRATQR